MTLSIACILISAIICLIVPTAIAVIMIVKRRASWMMFVLGVVVFTSTQLLLRMPIIDELRNTGWFMAANWFLSGLLMAFSAGIFEETGRYAAFKLIHRDLLTWENGIIFGLGHGGVEAFSITGMYYVDLIAGIVSGRYNTALLNDPPYYFLMGSVQRIFAISVHIGFTMLVMYAVKRRKLWCFILAIFAHGLVDIMLPVFWEFSRWAMLGIFAAFGVLGVITTVRMKAALSPATQRT